MTMHPDRGYALQRRRQFLKSLAAAAGLAAMATEQALGSSLLLRAAQDDKPTGNDEICTGSALYSYTSSRTYQKIETATVVLPGDPGITTMSYSMAITSSYSLGLTYTSDYPEGCSESMTELHSFAIDPAKTLTYSLIFSSDGVGYSMTVSRAHDFTLFETHKSTISYAYPCFGPRSLEAHSDYAAQWLSKKAHSSRNQTIDCKEDLFHIFAQGRGLAQVNF